MKKPEKSLRYKSPFYSMAMAAISIFIAEIITMYIVHSFEGLSEVQIAIADSTILLILIAPSIYFFFVQPLMIYINELRAAKDVEDTLYNLSITDELTGLHNRRGFFTLTEYLLKVAKREKQGIYLLYLDLDNMKEINDTFGHSEGDNVLIDIAHILKTNYRDSDVIARIGGDEFVVVPVGTTGDNVELITDRLQKQIDIHNEKSNRSYKLSVSKGIVYYDSEKPCSIDELLTEADKLMYEHKKFKQKILA